MATVTAFTAERSKQIEDNSIVNGTIVAGNLILTRHNGSQFSAGSVIGPTGPQGPSGGIPDALDDGKTYVRENEDWVDLQTKLAPLDGKRYLRRNGDWLEADRPWSLIFDNSTPSTPAGFSTSNLSTGYAWSVRMWGTGHHVTYNFQFVSDLAGLNNFDRVRMTFPAELRPIHNLFVNASGFIAGQSGTTRGLSLAKFVLGQNGELSGSKDVVVSPLHTGNPGANGQVMLYSSSRKMEWTLSGSFVRSAFTIPAGANPI